MTKNIDEIIKVIEGSIYKEDYFFQKASAMDDPFPLLKPLKDKGFFDPNKNPELKKDPKNKEFFFPKWNVLGYLENVSVKNAENPDIKVTANLVDIIEPLIDFRNNNDKVGNYRTDQSIIRIIFKLPIKCIKRSYIKFIGLTLRSEFGARLIEFEIKKTVFPRLIEDQSVDLILELLNVILDYKINETKYLLEFESVIDDYTLKSMLDEYNPKIAELCSTEAAHVGIKKITKILREDKNQFDYIQIPTIENHPQSRYSEDYELQLVRFVRDMLESADPNQIRDLITNLIEDKHSIFNRIAIHLINYRYKELNGIFWDSEENPLNDFKLKHELYELFRSQASNFSSEQLSTLINWIETKDYYIPPEIIDLSDKEKIEAYKKKVLLEPLLTSGNEKVKILYNKYHQLNPKKIDHPGFNIWLSGLSASKSSLEKSAFFVKSNEDIANYFINYTKEGPLYSEFTLAQTFRESVTEKPGKFARNIKPFLNVKPRYQHALLWGFQEAWGKNRNFQWESVFNFILELISSEEFWTGNDEYNTWTISIIADLIKEGTKRDDNAFDSELLPYAKEILMNIVTKTKSDLNDNPKNIVFDVLNSVKGKIFSAMINYSLRCVRLLPEEKKWDQTIKNDFSRRLDKNNEPTPEFIFIIAQYLPNLCYLDNKWVEENINLIFDKNDDNRWIGAFTGYLHYSNKFHENIYLLLKREGHYDKAIETDFSDRRITWRLVQHICSFYLMDKEKLDDENSLIYILVERGSSEKLSDVVNFISRNRKNITDEARGKIKPLWKKIFDKASENENNAEYQEILSDLSKWLSLIDFIDRNSFRRLKLSVKYIDRSFNYYLFIKCLLNHVENTPLEVGELYLTILENNIYPDYKIEDIQMLVEKLYIHNQKNNANIICSFYERKGMYFLEEIRIKFN